MLSLVIFNICVDMVVQQWRATLPPWPIDELTLFYVWTMECLQRDRAIEDTEGIRLFHRSI